MSGGSFMAFLYAFAGLFAGKPAPTGDTQLSGLVKYLWERVYPRRGPHRLYISVRKAIRFAPL
ncbi:protein of unknown function [Pseudomonas sp. JV551A1]|nr:protein of unknown function [Pseudomonas sp. JV551A1]